ncbi:hypothetical protein [Streptomyces sp. NPDC058280]|uniref:hypothetical protein n=1 Tax=Streptomyces sp. NPDC058280 TaxID=3346419 RepID=UPI0036E4A40B
MRQELVHAAVESGRPDIVGSALAQILGGPVICDRTVWYYALVPPQTTETWKSPLAVVRGRGGWLVVPRLDWTDPVGVYWAVPPDAVGKYCAPGAVAEVLRVGQARIAGDSS